MSTAITLSIKWDPRRHVATFQGPGGFTQVLMTGRDVEAIAQVWGLDLRLENTDKRTGS